MPAVKVGREVYSYDAAFQFAAVRNPYAWMISFLFMVNLCDAIGSTVPANVLPLWFCPTDPRQSAQCSLRPDSATVFIQRSPRRTNIRDPTLCRLHH